jgi:hypothetical protein
MSVGSCGLGLLIIAVTCFTSDICEVVPVFDLAIEALLRGNGESFGSEEHSATASTLIR